MNVIWVHGPVRGIGIDPIAHAGGHFSEFINVTKHRLPAAGIELGDPVSLYVLFAGEPELLFDEKLNRQPMAIPAGLAGDMKALHGSVPREDVLKDPGFDMVGARSAICGRWALVEDPGGSALTLGYRGGKDTLTLPHLQNLVLQGR